MTGSLPPPAAGIQHIRALEYALRRLLLEDQPIADPATLAAQWQAAALTYFPLLAAEIRTAAAAVAQLDQTSTEATGRTAAPAMRHLAHLRARALGEAPTAEVKHATPPDERPAGRRSAVARSTPPEKALPTSVSTSPLDAPVQTIPRFDKRYAPSLQKLGIATCGDLLRHFPRRYDDYSHLATIAELVAGQEVTIEVTVVRSGAVGLYGKRGRRVEVVFGDATGTIKAVWFNQEWVAKQVTPGLKLYVSGKVESFAGRLQFTSPVYERVGAAEAVHTGRLVPVYPSVSGLSQNWLRGRIKWLVDNVSYTVADPYTDAFRQRWRLMPLHEALSQVHFPDSDAERDAARRRLGFDDVFLLQLALLRFKRDWQRQGGAVALSVTGERLAELVACLPFELTAGQAAALRDVLADTATVNPMSRLMQGDVGSGKTAVAALAMLVAVENGYQAAMMAPTEILAEQHARTLSTLFAAVNPMLQPELITGGIGDAARRQAWARMETGQSQVAVGTHALIQEQGAFSRLALVVVDEQHRFGVMQRAALRKKGSAPHLLAMTATPIPRTLALTLHGDLDLSVIRDMPIGRLPIRTRYLDNDRRSSAYAFVRKEIASGRQAFVICPLVEESEAIEAKSAIAEYERLKTEVFPDLRLELVHGRLKPAEKDVAMRRFRDREADILVATTVVEVGVDVPNASVMLIEGAERFGVAQLHQLRGRVGRSEFQSYCMLLASDQLSAEGEERLRVVESTTDGFRLAEEDLRLRGPGAFFGVAQSGMQPYLALAGEDTLELARAAALDVLDRDPDLAAAEHRVIASLASAVWERLKAQTEWH